MSQARAYSEEVAGLIDEEIKAILDTAYARCREILSQNMDALERTAQYLLEFETMSAEDFQLVFQPPEVLERQEEWGAGPANPASRGKGRRTAVSRPRGRRRWPPPAGGGRSCPVQGGRDASAAANPIAPTD